MHRYAKAALRKGDITQKGVSMPNKALYRESKCVLTCKKVFKRIVFHNKVFYKALLALSGKA